MCLSNRSISQLVVELGLLEDTGRIHVHSDTHRAQVAHSQNTTDDVAAKIVKDQDLPDELSLGSENRPGGRKAVCVAIIVLVLGNCLVEVEDLLQRRWQQL
jgi:hypothetical protein